MGTNFRIIDLGVILAGIGCMTVVLTAGFNSSNTAYRIKCQDNLKKIGVALSGYASKNNADKLILISPPCDFSKIENQMYKKEAWFETCKKFELKRFFTVRPSFIVHKKTKPLDVVGNINSKILFMGGKKDPTVHFWHCIELFKKTKCAKKLVLYENGIHAEDLFLHDKTGFMQTCFDWLDEKKDT